MSAPHQDSGSDTGLASELRRQCEVLRMRPIPLNHMIPLMQRAADALDAAWNRRPSPAAPESDDPERHPDFYTWTWDVWVSGGNWRAEYGWKKPAGNVTNLRPLFKHPKGSPAAPAAEDGSADSIRIVSSSAPFEPAVHAAIRKVGGIVHSDGNLFFTNTAKFLAAVDELARHAAAELVSAAGSGQDDGEAFDARRNCRMEGFCGVPDECNAEGHCCGVPDASPVAGSLQGKISDEEILALAKRHGGFTAGDERGVILWSGLMEGGIVGFARAFLCAAGVPAGAAQSGWPDGLLDRIKAAEQRIADNHAPRRIPADPHGGDVDLVLAEVRYLIEGRWPPFWIKEPHPSRAAEGREINKEK